MQLIVGNLQEAEVAVAYFKGLEAQPVDTQLEDPRVVKKSTKAPKESTKSGKSIDDLRAAAVAYRDANGKEALADVLGGRKLAEIDPSEYDALVSELSK